MKKLLLPFLALLFLISCEKESSNDLITENKTYIDDSAKKGNSKKRNVCHKGKIINISINALAAHQAHGDAVDMDGDGYFDIDNPCSETDCDDMTYDLDNSCGCVEGEVKIDFNGPLFVAPADEPGFYNWQGAIDACNLKKTDGCGWFLPNQEELNALFYARNVIGGFDESGSSPGSYYWSSSEFDVDDAWGQFFDFGSQFVVFKNGANSCRCVRR